ncbi:MAG: branched-chain amino acid ABC transporter permease [Clostridiales Family XIII bacterium]|jgi:branched-chain amino acid transport system permease protein|nr:branched-chain amino acid ABC transporter permease [Clostridiales Family XIII bacterium]
MSSVFNKIKDNVTEGVRENQEDAIKRGAGAGKRTILIWGIAIIVLVTVPTYAGDYVLNVMILMLLYMALGQMWNLLGGYAGLVSLGQQSFIGIGGYALAIVSQKYGLPALLAFGIAAGVSVVFALVISIPIFKMQGVYFTIGTWIVSECLALWFSTWAWANYAQGYNITITYQMTATHIYYVALAIGVGSLIVVFFILRSRLGLALMAMRDNESAAEVRGVELYRTKLKCFLISACVTGVAGAGIYLQQAFIQPTNAFGISWTVSMVFMVVIGGLGTVEGPIIGAVIYVVLRQVLYNFPGISMVILGIIAIAIILLAPKGIMGIFGRRVTIDIFSVRRK